MVNYKLFDLLTTFPHIAGRLQRTHRDPTAFCWLYLCKGFAYEYYQTDKNKQLVSWFWLEDEFIIPTSPYSNIVFSIDAESLEYDHSGTFNLLRAGEEFRDVYYFRRARHNLQIAERISDIQYLSPFQNYMKLKQCLPEVFEYASEETIASYLNTGLSELRKFMLKRPDFLKSGFTH